jgi:predicted methyltransferase
LAEDRIVAEPEHNTQTISPNFTLDQAISHASRPDTDRSFDDQFYPAAVLAFAGVQPGIRMAFIGSAAVYYTSIASLVAGVDGVVYVQNACWSVRDFPGVMTQWVNRIKASPFRNITPIVTDMKQIQFPEPLDLIFFDRFYHDIIRHDPSHIDPMNRCLYAALKSGGHLVVLDHSAAEGSGLRDVQELHRIDPAVVVDQLTAVGFKLAGESQAARNPEDGRTLMARRDIMTNTDRFLLRFQKPD